MKIKQTKKQRLQRAKGLISAYCMNHEQNLESRLSALEKETQEIITLLDKRQQALEKRVEKMERPVGAGGNGGASSGIEFGGRGVSSDYCECKEPLLIMEGHVYNHKFCFRCNKGLRLLQPMATKEECTCKNPDTRCPHCNKEGICFRCDKPIKTEELKMKIVAVLDEELNKQGVY